VDRRDITRQALGIALHRHGVAVDEADRIVQLVRDAGHETAQRGHLFGMDQLLLGGLEVFVGAAQGLVGTPQFAHRPASDDQAHHLADAVVARRTIQRDRDGAAVGRLEPDLEILRGMAALVAEQAAGMLARFLVGEQVEDRPPVQRGGVDAEQRGQRLVDALDHPGAAADDQQVRHRGQHR
jgi:hypothetical protein